MFFPSKIDLVISQHDTTKKVLETKTSEVSQSWETPLEKN